MIQPTTLFFTRNKITQNLPPLSLLLAAFHKDHTHDFSVHPVREKTYASISEEYYFPSLKTCIATQDCLGRQTDKTLPYFLIGPRQPFLEVSRYFNHRMSMDTSPIVPASEGISDSNCRRGFTLRCLKTITSG